MFCGGGGGVFHVCLNLCWGCVCARKLTYPRSVSGLTLHRGREPMAVNLGVTWQDSETLADDIATALNLFDYSF